MGSDCPVNTDQCRNCIVVKQKKLHILQVAFGDETKNLAYKKSIPWSLMCSSSSTDVNSEQRVQKMSRRVLEKILVHETDVLKD